MNGRQNASIIDIKMGTSTVTRNITTDKRLAKRVAKDQATTSQKLGLKIIGYVIKSKQKTIEEKFYKFPYKTVEDIPVVLRRLFSWPKCENEAEGMHDEDDDLRVKSFDHEMVDEQREELKMSKKEKPQDEEIKEGQQADQMPLDGVNQEAVETILCELQRLEAFLVNRSQRDIKGASILILCDHFSRSYTVKMIDLSTIEVYEDPYQRDHGLITGV